MIIYIMDLRIWNLSHKKLKKAQIHMHQDDISKTLILLILI